MVNAFLLSFSIVYTQDYEQALEYCKANNGIEKYIAMTVGSDIVSCKNGAKFKIDKE